MRNIIFYTVFILNILNSIANAQIPMGSWRTHFAYDIVNQISLSENKVFALSDGALFSIDTDDQGLEFYSKITGLNDANIITIDYNKFNKELFIVYLNGNIDVMTSSGIVNIPDLFNKQMSSSKVVNSVFFTQDRAYLGCNFGIMVVNTKKYEIADTYFIGNNSSEVNVSNITIHNNTIYAVSGSSIYTASVTNPNLVNFEFWSKMNALPGEGNIQNVLSYAGKLFIQRNNKLYYQESNNTWMPIMTGINIALAKMSRDKFIVFDGINIVYLLNEQLQVKPVINTGLVYDIEYEANADKFWFAKRDLGVVSFIQNAGSTPPTIVPFKPNGPIVNIPYSMTFANNKLFVVSGRPRNEEFMDASLMMYKEGKWMNIVAKTITDSTKYRTINFVNVAVDPADENHFFVTSFGAGVYEFRNNKFFKWHLNNNSLLQPHFLVPNNPWLYTRVDGATFDKDGNMFALNNAVDAKVKILMKNGTWKELKYPSLSNEILNNILINNQNPNQKWITTYNAGQLTVIDDKGTLLEQSDDKPITFNSFTDSEEEGGTITFNRQYCIAQDKNGVIWLGTEIGPLLFYNTNKVFEPGYTCSRVKIPLNDGNNGAAYLLKDEKVKAIAIDGANRKWIGTETSGVYLLSENGQETIQHFTTQNSPLQSNDILSIAINPNTGEVFIGTGMGLVSYQSDASLAGSVFGEVHAYPNPVREGYTGVITITGLVDKTFVKITDINGNLVKQTMSNGSLATWDAKDKNGRKVNTGIYLAICVNEDGTQSTITKIMIIN